MSLTCNDIYLNLESFNDNLGKIPDVDPEEDLPIW
jgi:hypothetical protein